MESSSVDTACPAVFLTRGRVTPASPDLVQRRPVTPPFDTGSPAAIYAFAYISEPGVVSNSPVSSSVFRPDRIIGQPP